LLSGFSLDGDEEDLKHVHKLTAKLEHADQGAGGLGALGERARGTECQAARDHLERCHTKRCRGKTPKPWCLMSS
jgi:hypothetical protein